MFRIVQSNSCSATAKSSSLPPRAEFDTSRSHVASRSVSGVQLAIERLIAQLAEPVSRPQLGGQLIDERIGFPIDGGVLCPCPLVQAVDHLLHRRPLVELIQVVQHVQCVTQERAAILNLFLLRRRCRFLSRRGIGFWRASGNRSRQ